MGLEEAKKLLDELDEADERFQRLFGSWEVFEWATQEMQRRRELRKARREARDATIFEAPTPAPFGSLKDSPSATLQRRVEVLEPQLRHLIRRLDRERLI